MGFLGRKLVAQVAKHVWRQLLPRSRQAVFDQKVFIVQEQLWVGLIREGQLLAAVLGGFHQAWVIVGQVNVIFDQKAVQVHEGPLAGQGSEGLVRYQDQVRRLPGNDLAAKPVKVVVLGDPGFIFDHDLGMGLFKFFDGIVDHLVGLAVGHIPAAASIDAQGQDLLLLAVVDKGPSGQ